MVLKIDEHLYNYLDMSDLWGADTKCVIKVPPLYSPLRFLPIIR
jgi:hypothetical protein